MNATYHQPPTVSIITCMGTPVGAADVVVAIRQSPCCHPLISHSKDNKQSITPFFLAFICGIKLREILGMYEMPMKISKG